MKSVLSKVHAGLVVMFFIFALMVVMSKYFYQLWVGDTIDIPFEVTVAMSVCVFVQTFGTLNMYLINGVGFIRLQTILYVLFAIAAWPLFIFSCRWGIVGVIAIPALVYLTQGICCDIQLHKIINNTASGIWKK